MTEQPDSYETEFGARLRSYAARGVAGSPGPDIGRLAMTINRQSWTSWLRSGGLLAGAAALGLVVALGGLSLLRLGPQLGVKPSPQPSATAPAPSAFESAQPTASATLQGETPGPGAAAPKGALYIRGLTIAEVIEIAQGANFSCESVAGNVPGDAALFELICTVDDRAAGYSYALTAAYWTLDRISEFRLVAHPLGQTTDPAKARGVFDTVLALPFEGSDLQAAVSWFATNMDNPACAPCTKGFGEDKVEIQASSLPGASAITITGTATVP
jgi:hypothetical protein